LKKENDLELFTEDDFHKANELKDKAYRIMEVYNNFERKYGKLKGSVFDGGFYTEVNTNLMNESEYELYKKVEKQIELLNDIFA
jgi:hypothetical protein